MAERNSIPSEIDAAAAQWLVRRDRGLTPAEQDEFLQWRQQDPRRAAAFARHEATLGRIMQLGDWNPLLAAEPNPELFAPTRRTRPWYRRHGITWSAAAAAVTLAALVGWSELPVAPPPRTVSQSYLRVNERLALPDGSLVELKDGSRVDVAYTLAERRVKLIDGEAHFTVAKNPLRPFIVEANGVAVRAVGTAFNVRLDIAAVEVLVTEGRVEVGEENASRVAAVRSSTGRGAGPATLAPLATLEAGERSLVPLAPASAPPSITSVTPAQIRAALSWQTPRLQFNATPLADAVAEFNRQGSTTGARRLVLEDAELGRIPIGGTFRVDNVEGFVRLLSYTLNVQAEERGDNRIVLSRAR